MKYLVLLRGINVGGNSIIKMADLKNALEDAGFNAVKTYIQSGNIILESDETNKSVITRSLEETIHHVFHTESRAVVLTPRELRAVIVEAPEDWKKRADLRRYVAFLIGGVKPLDVIKEIRLKEGTDFVRAGKGVVYMTTLLSGITKSGFSKLVSQPVYKDLTTRNFNTVLKMLELMEMG